MLWRRLAKSQTFGPVLGLVMLALLYYSRALLGDQVLLPGAMLGGFAPFGSNLHAPWNILQWDALGQYYPWRLLAHRQLQDGQIPLWNFFQFSGTPLLANAQSAVFYPPSLLFWFFDVAYAFGLSALAHLLLASLGTFALARRWGLTRAGSLVAAIGFGYCGYLTAWITLPTLADTAAWLPLLLLLQEASLENVHKHHEEALTLPSSNPCTGWNPSTGRGIRSQFPASIVNPEGPSLLSRSGRRSQSLFPIALSCALLAGHAQVFIYLLLALLLHALLLPQRGRALCQLLCGTAITAGLCAVQLLPTLELARLGHRAAQGGASMAGWQFVRDHALQPSDAFSLFVPNWPMSWGTLNENFGYVGVGIATLAAASVVFAIIARRAPSARPGAPTSTGAMLFPLGLAAAGLLFAFGTPVAALFYWYVPGLAQMGGVGRALLWWSLGMSLLAGMGLTALQRLYPRRIVTVVALLFVGTELLSTAWQHQTLAPRGSIYPPTETTTWLQQHLQTGQRVLFMTSRRQWQPAERLADAGGHPDGVLPPNGATVYGIEDVDGYDSLASLRYRQFVAGHEPDGVSPQWNGNMILLDQGAWPELDALQVRYIVSTRELFDLPSGFTLAHVADQCNIYEYSGRHRSPKSGADFYPGWKQGKYQPESFRLGGFISFCFLGLMVMMGYSRLIRANRPIF